LLNRYYYLHDSVVVVPPPPAFPLAAAAAPQREFDVIERHESISKAHKGLAIAIALLTSPSSSCERAF
jgi:hypothetical protein